MELLVGTSVGWVYVLYGNVSSLQKDKWRGLQVC
jgi:hypothetical protein